MLRGVHLDITGSYGTQLHLLGDQIRTTVTQIVHDVLGADDDTRTTGAPSTSPSPTSSPATPSTPPPNSDVAREMSEHF